MGFGKKVAARDEGGKSSKKREQSVDAADKDGFVPSSAEELKDYRRRARRKEKEKQRNKEALREARSKKFVPEKREHIAGINERKLLVIYKKIIKEKIATFTEDKKHDRRWVPCLPRYRYERDLRAADSAFLFDIQQTLSKMSWKDLKRLVKAGMGRSKEFVDMSSTFRFVETMVFQVLGVESDSVDVRYRLTDRDATIALWPVKPNEELMSKKEAADVKKGKKAKSPVSESEDEDEKPSKKVKSKDEGDEKPSKKAKTEKKAKKAKELTDESTVSKLKDRPKGGPKTKLLNLIPRKGISFKKLLSKAKEEGLPKAKIGAWVKVMSKNGFIGIE
jgi:hypothetical protein